MVVSRTTLLLERRPRSRARWLLLAVLVPAKQASSAASLGRAVAPERSAVAAAFSAGCVPDAVVGFRRLVVAPYERGDVLRDRPDLEMFLGLELARFRRDIR